MKIKKELLDFITEARKRGFSDLKIKKALVNKKWPVKLIDEAFHELRPKFKSKNQVSIYLSDDLLKVLSKRAKKNMYTISEQIEDILRRSCVTYKGSSSTKPIKIDDPLVGAFSRTRRGRKPKKKKKKKK